MNVETPDVSATPAASTPSPEPGRRPRRRKVLIAGITVAIIGVAAVAAADPFRGSTPAAARNADSTSLQAVTQGTLIQQTQVDATLGYARSYTVTSQGGASQPSAPASGSAASGPEQGTSGSGSAGTVTALPAPGQVVRQGHRLYSVSGSPVVLLYGSTPSYRSLSQGMSGQDVTELNADLVALGYASRNDLSPTSDYFGLATATALKALQAYLGIPQTGVLALGQAVFLPTAARITSLSASLGQPISPGSPVLDATSTTRQVDVGLDASQQSDVTVGDKVAITLPDNKTTPGVVTSVGKVATCPPGGGGSAAGSSSPNGGVCPGSSAGSTSTPTITVDVKPSDPAATGTWDQAPVEVTITTASARDALIVPVDALLARAGGSYAVEVAGAHGADHLVPVTPGLFDDANGTVQVTGPGLHPGQKVVVPNT